MSTINTQDEELLDKVKEKIEQISGLPDSNSWTQKDYDFLVYYIDEKSGVRISLSTLKRIWRNENNRLPHISTLDALSQVAFQKKWLSIKADFTPKREIAKPDKALRFKNYRWVVLSVIAIGLMIYLGYGFLKNNAAESVINKENILFTARTSVQNKVPNSVVFDYDVSTVKATKFYLQQSWDTRRRVEITKENHQQTDIYYLPGLYFAKLIADTTVIAQIPVHIKTEDWFIQTNLNGKDKGYEKQQMLANGTLDLSKVINLEHHKELDSGFNAVLYNSREFNTNGDDFRFSSKVKLDSRQLIQCAKISILLKGEKDYFLVQLINKGCESDAFLKLSEKEVSGKHNDLTILGVEANEWQNMEVQVRDKQLILSLNGQEIYKNSYENPIGFLKEITYVLNGVGALDNVELKDADGNITYSDYFD